MKERYINPFTDFGFKKLFGSEPKRIQERVFQRLFETAEIARFDPSEHEAYEESLKIYRDLKNVMDTQFEEGRDEGWAEGLVKGRKEGRKDGQREREKQIARDMKLSGESLEKIMTYTGLTEDQIRQL